MSEEQQERKERLTHLRERARSVTQLTQDSPELLHDVDAAARVATLVQELSLYQSELEVQNEELLEAQAWAARALTEFSTIFESMPVAAVVIDLGFRILEANRMAVELLGLPANSRYTPKSLLTMLDEDSRTVFYAATRTIPSGEAVRLPDLHVLPRRSARRVPVELLFASLDPTRAEVDRLLVLLADRTAEMEFDRTRVLFQAMLDSSALPMYAYDTQGLCLLANEAMLADLGLPMSKVMGHTRHDWLPLAEVIEAHNLEAEVIRTGRPIVLEEMRETDEGTRVIATTRFPMRDTSSRIFAVGGIATDLTDIRQAQLDLHLAAEVLARSAEGVIITDGDNRIVSVNSAYESMTGYTQAELIGVRPSVFQSGRHPESFYCDLWHTLNTTNYWTGELWNRRKNGEVFPQETRIIRMLDEDGFVRNYAALALDISERKRNQEEIERLAFYDSLTGAPTRRLLLERISELVEDAELTGHEFALLYLDIDDFKGVNDSLGHEAGDLLMIATIGRLREQLAAEELVARLSGDEFVVVIPNAGPEKAARVAEQVATAMRRPFVVESNLIHTSVSIGIALYPRDGSGPNSLLRSGDTAMYEVKHEGRNSWRFFDSETFNVQERRGAIVRGLRQALDSGEFRLFYQPQVDIASMTMTGVEVLLRWNNSDLGNPSPAEFIPIAEAGGSILAIGEWVLAQSLHQVAEWRRRGMGDIDLAVNVSGRHFGQAGFAEVVLRELERSGWPSAQLELEITENWAMRRPEASAEVMRVLHDRGVRFALDDFGTGYSSLANLRLFPIDTIKIDCSFVWQIGVDPAGEAVVRSIIALAEELSLRCVAEGVETPEQSDYLRRRRCTSVQGYMYARPMPAEELWEWFSNFRAEHTAATPGERVTAGELD